jgi:hypothetical protein
MARAARKTPQPEVRDIVQSTADYEAWAARRTPMIATDIAHKHELMKADRFAFFRATFYRWAELWPRVCPDLEAGPHLLCVGDLHVENFGVWRDLEGRLVWGVNDFDEAQEAAFTVDLVRLLASVMLSRDHAKVRLDDEQVAELVRAGWLRAMTKDAQPFVLNGRHKWLTRLAQRKLKNARAYWKKMERMGPAYPQEAFGEPLAVAALHPGAGGALLRHRVAGLGSLGHPRVVALADWNGGYVAREAKALTPSAWIWARGGAAEDAPFRYDEILAQAIHCPDPTLSTHEGWLIRRLAPDGSRVELADLPDRRDDEKMFQAMGREIGNIHRRAPQAPEAVAALKGLPSARLVGAARDMVTALTADWETFRAAPAPRAPAKVKIKVAAPKSEAAQAAAARAG